MEGNVVTENLFTCMCEQLPILFTAKPEDGGGFQYSCDNCEIRTIVFETPEIAAEAWNALIATKKISMKCTSIDIAVARLLPNAKFIGIVVAKIRLDSYPNIQLEIEFACTKETNYDVTWRCNIIHHNQLTESTKEGVGTIINSKIFKNRINVFVNTFFQFLGNLDLVKG